MKLNKALLVLILISLTYAESKHEKIYKLLDLTGADKTLTVLKTQMTDLIKKASPEVSTDLLDTLFAKMNKEGLYALSIQIYDNNLDEATIDGLIAFYKTEVGKTYIEKMPVIMKESMQAGAAWGQQILMEAIQNLKKRGYKIQGI